MYKLVLYYLIGLLCFAVVLSLLGLLSFNPISLIISVFFLLAVGVITNKIFSIVFESTPSIDSTYISLLILALIITPIHSYHDLGFFFWAAVWTVAGKYIFAFRNRHIFNPVALGVFLPSVFLGQSASWWVGTLPMFIPVLLGGLLIAKKIDRKPMIIAFILSAVLTIMAASFSNGPNILVLMRKIFADTAVLFFAFVMLTEPLTTPPTKNLRIIYAVIVGFLFAPRIHLDSIYTTPEMALVIGNVFSYMVSLKERLTLTLAQKIQLGPDIYELVFQTPRKFDYKPGQYLEWTLAHQRVDTRGNRRYFTISSSPTEDDLRVGIKFYPQSSSYKRRMFELNQGDSVSIVSLAGDFTMPDNPAKKLVFIAGGIGITPFRSMLKYLLDTNQQRDIVVFYVNKNASEIVYQDILFSAQSKLGIKTVYILSDKDNIPVNWQGKVGRITPEMISAEVPDFKERKFYISGPHSMVDAYKTSLKKLHVPGSQIITDYFPGFV